MKLSRTRIKHTPVVQNSNLKAISFSFVIRFLYATIKSKPSHAHVKYPTKKRNKLQRRPKTTMKRVSRQFLGNTVSRYCPSFRNGCLRGWRLLTLLCCWFTCSDILKPFLLTYLQQNASDPSRTYHNAASTCLIALRKTLKYGGRRNVPTSDEILAITVSSLRRMRVSQLAVRCSTLITLRL